MAALANEFGLLQKIWHQQQEMTLTTATFPAWSKSFLTTTNELGIIKKIDAVLNSGTGSLICSSAEIYQSPLSSTRFMHQLLGAEKMFIAQKGLELESRWRHTPRPYLLPVVACCYCFQPLSSMREQPIWLNAARISCFEEECAGTKVTFLDDYQLLLQINIKSFQRLYQFCVQALCACVQYHFASFGEAAADFHLPVGIEFPELFHLWAQKVSPLTCDWYEMRKYGEQQWILRRYHQYNSEEAVALKDFLR